MSDRKLLNTFDTTSISPAEEQDIEQKIYFDITDRFFQILKIAPIFNAIAGIFVVWVFYKQIDTTITISWFIALILADIVCITIAYYYQRHRSYTSYTKRWKYLYIALHVLLCSVWSSVGILFVTDNVQYQFFLMAIIFLLTIAFGLGTITDFTASFICLCCLLSPYVTSHLYKGLAFIQTANSSVNIDLQFGIIVLMTSAILMIMSYFGSQLIRKSLKLGYINAALSEKLAAANQDLAEANISLDQKVKDRTLELENTLELVTHQATHDLLTDLPNQRLLQHYIQESIEQAVRTHSVFAVAFLSLNRTKIISDSLGHQTGSLVIKAFADRLKSLQDQSNAISSFTHYTITHAWGDVFVIVLSPLRNEDTTSIIRNLFSILQEPFYLAEKSFSLTASIGVCLYPKDGPDVKTLLMNAEAAMFRAKKYGGNKFEFYTADLNAHTSKQLELESGLHTALTQEEFIVYYQPIVDIKTYEIVGMEALIRWQHPTLGLVSPADFIPVAEEIGLIVPLGEWVLKKACLQTKHWHSSGFPNLKVSVNLAAKQLAQESVIATISNVLKETNFPASALELEFTETAILDEKIIPIAKKLKEMGVHLAIDDFGTGYSGLTYVRQFSIDRLKIDKSFVQDIGKKPESETIILTIIEMAKKLEMQTLAEGVETVEQLQFLKDHDCDLIQGYYFSRPVDSDAFTSLLSKKFSVQSDQSKPIN